MTLPLKEKQPSEVRDYDVDFSRAMPEDDFITTMEAAVEPPDDLLVSALQNMSPIVKVWHQAGTGGLTYKVTVKVGTNQGRVLEAEYRMRVKDN